MSRFFTLFDSCLYAVTKLNLKFAVNQPAVGPQEEPKTQPQQFAQTFKEPKVYDKEIVDKIIA